MVLDRLVRSLQSVCIAGLRKPTTIYTHVSYRGVTKLAQSLIQ